MTRRRLCSVCHAPATWALEHSRPACRIAMDGAVSRFTERWHEFRCDQHVDAAKPGW